MNPFVNPDNETAREIGAMKTATPRWTDPRHLKVGDRFDTEFESGCVVTQEPDSADPRPGSYFLALDSEGVECEFWSAMVIGHPDRVAYLAKRRKQ